jgi:NAD(P)-dependent dehydrogenase (short-subunit alcohol dehydrogenase family)
MLGFALTMSKAADVTLSGSTGRIINISSIQGGLCVWSLF